MLEGFPRASTGHRAITLGHVAARADIVHRGQLHVRWLTVSFPILLRGARGAARSAARAAAGASIIAARAVPPASTGSTVTTGIIPGAPRAAPVRSAASVRSPDPG